ncbi:hypothetical protein ACPOL_0763 [Acidisarcina polymorpha]|uniref:Uncharacterized protein n=1 Tax=Acidisarcina polymorpha TaxID=2211140 RepID=A0A2Z5FUF6_9BACT|nr:beta-L-arabinofuranosidase domain-containing protein [Acidisarcina polymorpha]AXC10124.1 hypothetical protein ACPOL_0763 [Acidisarcina polymorpha]
MFERQNDQEQEIAFAQPGSYLAIWWTWRAGDKIQLSLPMRLNEESLPGDPNPVATLYGLLMLATTMGIAM